MIGDEKIKASRGALSLSDSGSGVMCVELRDGHRCLRFESLEEVEAAIKSKRLAVRKWVVTVPQRNCIVKRLILPALDVSEAVRMVEYEIGSLVPLPLEEISYGCTVLSKVENMLTVVVWIVKLEMLGGIIDSEIKQ